MTERTAADRIARPGLPVRPPARAPAPVGRRRAATLAAVLAAWLAADPGHAQQPAPDILYTVRPDDTLIGIAGRLLEPPERWRDLQRLNRIGTPTRLQPGTVLRVRPQWLRGEPASFTLDAVGGSASLDGAPARPGDTGREGSRIETGADGVVTLRLGDGTVLTIPPASAVRVDRLRQYLEQDAIEARIGIERGAIDTRSVPGRKRGLEIRTPAATAAVRGTEFRVRARERDTAVEVLAGTVAAASPGGSAQVGAGEGVIAGADRPPRVERLLPAPALDGLAPRLESVTGVLPFTPVEAAAGYRVQVAADPGFTRVLSDRIAAAPEATIASREDGRLHVRVRAVSAIGLEGREATAVVEVAARPEPPLPLRPPERAVVFDEAVALAWALPEGVSGFRLQVAADPGFAAPLHDSTAPEAARTVSLPRLEGVSATWWWRVASIAGARRGPFSAPRAVEQRPLGGAPSGIVDDDRIELSWPALPGHRYEVQVAAGAAFAAPLLQGSPTEPRMLVEGLEPGTWFARVRSIDPQGVVSPYGPAQRFEVRALLRSGAGAPVGSGGGAPVELPDPR